MPFDIWYGPSGAILAIGESDAHAQFEPITEDGAAVVTLDTLGVDDPASLAVTHRIDVESKTLVER